MTNISTLDLNLLRVFDALMRERSVTAAAARLGLSQPAASLALGRLRDHLGDQLLVRTRDGMRPTPRAEEMAARVAQALTLVQDALQSGTSFVPTASDRSFTIMMSDIGEVTYLPRLIRRLQREAPGVRLVVRRLVRSRVQEELASGAVDLAVGWMNPVRDLCREVLFHEEFACILRRGHPRIRGRLTKAQFAAEWHLGVGRQALNPDGSDRPGEEALEMGLTSAMLRQRRIAMLVPHFLAAPHIIAHTDLLCVVPRQLGKVHAEFGAIRVADLPVRLESFEVALFWHKRFDTDRGGAWLRNLVRELFQQPRRG